MVLVKDGEDKLDRSCQICGIKQGQERKECSICNKKRKTNLVC